jgi:hypothetical protein
MSFARLHPDQEILKPSRLRTLRVKQSELAKTLQPAEKVGVELIRAEIGLRMLQERGD